MDLQCADDEDKQLIKRKILNAEPDECYNIQDVKGCKHVKGDTENRHTTRNEMENCKNDDNGHPGWLRTLKVIADVY